jgi:hypothetical protein
MAFIAVIQVATAEPEKRDTAWIGNTLFSNLEGFAIFIAVLVCTNVAASNDYQKERQFIKLN